MSKKDESYETQSGKAREKRLEKRAGWQER